jgi:hypothetical protein
VGRRRATNPGTLTGEPTPRLEPRGPHAPRARRG